MKLFLGLAALAVPMAFGASTAAEQTCSCEIQKMFNKYAKVSLEFKDKGYYMKPYNDFFHFIDDEILPQLAIEAKALGKTPSDLDAVILQAEPNWEGEWDAGYAKMKTEKAQIFFNATETIMYWNATAVFYNETKTYYNNTILERSNPEYSAWIHSLKDNDGFAVNMFSETDAIAFHKYFIKMLKSIKGSTIVSDFNTIFTYLQKTGPAAQQFLTFLEEYLIKYHPEIMEEIEDEIYKFARSTPLHNKDDYIKFSQDTVNSVHEHLENALVDMFGFANDSNEEWNQLFEAILGALISIMNDDKAMKFLEDHDKMFKKLEKNPPQVNFEQLYGFFVELTELSWFRRVMNKVAKVPQYIAGEIKEHQMVEVFVRFQDVLKEELRMGRTSAKPACICDGYNGADVFRFNQVVMPVCAAGVINLLN